MVDSGAAQPPRVDVVLDPAAPYGYTRVASLQANFEQSAARLLASDGWRGGGAPELVADLALEGGGVKGIGIVGAVSVLAEAGYRFARVAGTSAGSIAAALIAAIAKKGAPMTSLKGYLDDLTFTEFMQPKGKLHEFMDHHFGNAGEKLSDAAVLTHRMGVYDGNFLGTWLGPILARPRRPHLRRPQDHAAGRSRHEPPAEPPLPARRAHVRHHPRPAGPPALGLRLLRAEP